MFYVPFSIAMIAQSEKNKTKNILLLYMHVLFILYSLHVFYMFYCCHFKYSMFFMFYVSLLYTCLSENSSDELMLSIHM